MMEKEEEVLQGRRKEWPPVDRQRTCWFAAPLTGAAGGWPPASGAHASRPPTDSGDRPPLPTTAR